MSWAAYWGLDEHLAQPAAAHPLQKAADLRLKQDDQHQNGVLHYPVEHEAGGRIS